jgi:hypothetical protein
MAEGDDESKRSCALIVRVLDEPPKKLERRAGGNVIRLVRSDGELPENPSDITLPPSSS